MLIRPYIDSFTSWVCGRFLGLSVLFILIVGAHWALLAHRFNMPLAQSYGEWVYDQTSPFLGHPPLSWIRSTFLPLPPLAGISEQQFQNLLNARTSPLTLPDSSSRGDPLMPQFALEIRYAETRHPELLIAAPSSMTLDMQVRMVSVPHSITGKPSDERTLPLALKQGYAQLRIPDEKTIGEYWLILTEAPVQTRPEGLALLPHLRSMQVPSALISDLHGESPKNKLIFARKTFLFGADSAEFRSQLKAYSQTLEGSQQQSHAFALESLKILGEALADLRSFENSLFDPLKADHHLSTTAKEKVPAYVKQLLEHVAPLESRLTQLTAQNPFFQDKGVQQLYSSAFSTLRYAAMELNRLLKGPYDIDSGEIARQRRLCIEAELAQNRLRLKFLYVSAKP